MYMFKMAIHSLYSMIFNYTSFIKSFYFILAVFLFYPSPVVSQGSIELPPVEAFIAKWAPSGGSNLGSLQSFLI